MYALLLAVVSLFGEKVSPDNDWREYPRPELSRIPDVRLFRGTATSAFRDPTAVWHDGTLHLYFTVVTAAEDGRIYSYVARSASRDLVAWTPPVRLTRLDQSLNFSSPGNVIRVGDEWAMCVSSYPRPGYRVGDPVRYGDGTARIWLMRSKDLVTWGEPEVMRVKGDVPVAEMGRMIDPYLVEDAGEPGKWWCFYKQNGASRSWSRDLRHWTPAGSAPAGENVCILRERDGYVMFHSPQDGVGVKRSADLLAWRDEPPLELPRDGWNWAKGRLTAGFVLDARAVPDIGCYVLFFHGSGPKSELEGDFDRNSSIARLFSDDLRTWRCEPRAWRWIAPAERPEGPQAFAVEKTFRCPADLSRAVLRQTSLGVAETFVNGCRVGDVELKPGFTCAGEARRRPDLNRVISCAEWSLRSNQLSVPTDCCNRGERLGWMGEAEIRLPDGRVVSGCREKGIVR